LAGYGLWTQIRARILIPDPDSNPHYGSESGAALTHGLFGLFADILRAFYGLSGLDLYLEDMLGCVYEEGGNCFRQIWVKIRKIVGSATLLF
jgi:hypothetical protein